MYPGTRRHGKSPRSENAMVTAGFRWAPDTLPINMMIAITISPGATTAAVRLIVFGNASPIIPPPAATRTRKNVPSNSAKSLRHSRAVSLKSSSESAISWSRCVSQLEPSNRLLSADSRPLVRSLSAGIAEPAEQ